MPARTAVFLSVIAGAAAFASGPALRVDATQNRHPISPDIYGLNYYQDYGLGGVVRGGVCRWGGDVSTRYHWKYDAWDSAADWYFETYPARSDNELTLPDSSLFNSVAEMARRSNQKMIGTIPMIGWLPKNRDFGCSFRVSKYGTQQKTDRYNPDCGNGLESDGSRMYGNDPHDVSAPVDTGFAREWLQYLVQRYGKAERGGVSIYCLDNEPMIWHFVHWDVFPHPTTYDEMLQRATDYAEAIKAEDPTALIAGPDSAGWTSYFYSGLDWQSGWSTYPWKYYSNPVDRNAHGGVAFHDWYLQQMRDYERRTGRRLLDYLDLHAYLAPAGLALQQCHCATCGCDTASKALRLKSTRVFWDPNYLPPDNPDILEPPRLIPRMRDWVNDNYPGTRTAITEYNWGALDDLNGALAEADILGIFGREGLDMAAIWSPPTPDQPGAYAFRIYRDYDGIGGAFGETGVLAESGDPDTLSVFAAERSDGALTIVVVNKTGADVTSTLSLTANAMGPVAQVWRYSGANLSAIVREDDASAASGSLDATYPANSITLFVIPRAAGGTAPVVKAVVNAASYEARIAPGTIVAIFGSALGPDSLTPGTVSAASMVQTDAGGVRVLFDGVAAPVLYSRADQVGAVVPYIASISAVTHVQVEYAGRRSEPFEAPVGSLAPGIFTANAQGKGNAAALDQDGALNGPLNPAAAGSIVTLFATGEGVTTVPGVDGRVAIDILPQPAAKVQVEIGGISAEIKYAAAAPQAIAGALQVNAVVPAGVPPGPAAVKLRIGDQSSADGVTLAIR